MSKQKLAIAIVSGLAMILTFVPWYSSPQLGGRGVGSVATLELRGIALLYFITFLICVFNNRTNELKGRFLYISIVTSVVASIFSIYLVSLELENQSSIKLNFIGYMAVALGFVVPILSFTIKGYAKSTNTDYTTELEKLAKLKDQGIITQEEFDRKKKEIL